MNIVPMKFRNPEAANAAAKTGKPIAGLFRFVLNGNHILLCQGLEVIAAAPLDSPIFRLVVQDEHGRFITPPEGEKSCFN